MVVLFYLSLVAYVACFFVLRGWVRLLLKTLDIKVRHFCACMCIAMAIDFDCVGSVLYARAFGELSLNNTSWDIAARVWV
jgi:hypothetical protein